ncbi:MAG: T9SS type A sorting domain-containing protein [Bacteroidetes bacterium]|nr:T9SS type A sorting domain-containing protein [Bacteroidota bacterium]
MKRILRFSHILFLSFIGTLVFGQGATIHPTRTQTAVYFDISPPLTDIPMIVPVMKETDGEGIEEKEVPNKIGKKEFLHLKTTSFDLPEDPAWQKQEATDAPLSAAPIQNFDGMPNILGYYPPDTQGDIGIDKYVQVVNVNFAIYSKTGSILFGPASLNTIWTGIPEPWNSTNSGDPVVLFDQAANRWIITQFSLPPGYTQCAELVAISQTSDPTGAWFRYVFQYGSTMPDYPKFGIWPDGYYMSTNQFTGGGPWAGVGASAFERTKMLAGDPTAQMIYFDLTAAGDPSGMLPSDWDGVTTPVAGEPNHFTYYNDWSSPTDRYLRIWDFHADWVTPANSTFAQVASLVTAPFKSSLCTDPNGRGQCIPQPGTTVLLEDLSDRLMYRLQYRNFGGYRAMVTNHTVDVDNTGHAGIRWYELRNTGAGWGIYQQGSWAPDASHRWIGSIAMNSVGDIALGYSVSNATTTYPSIRYTGRKPGDPLGTMSVAEQTVIAGTGSQTGVYARWGDYSMMSVDPSDDVTFWYTTEYVQVTGSTSWKTRIASFLISNAPSALSASATAVAATTATLNGSVNPHGVATTYHFEYGTTTAYGSVTPTISAGAGSAAVNVSANITGLSGGATYHFRLVAVNSNGTSNSSELTFIPGAAILTTTAASAITVNTATSGGNITNDGGFAVTARGVCWSTGLSPTIANSHTSNGTGTGVFSSSVTGLLHSTLYHLRSYATSSAGTFYGNEVTFTTSAWTAVLSTTTPAAITASSASSGGTITSDGGFAVTARGVCWGTGLNPTLANSFTTNGLGTGNFTSSITGLVTGLTYHVRAYATSVVGTVYGNDLSFSTPCPVYLLPFTQGFDGTAIPNCWSQADHQGNGQIWQFGTITAYSPDNPVLTGNYAYLNSDAYGNGNSQNADLISPTLDLSAYSTGALSFNYYFRWYDPSTVTLSYSINNGTTWVVLLNLTAESANPSVFSQSIPAIAGQAQVKFKWNYTGSYGYYWAIDDVQITGLPVNKQLSNITVPSATTNCYNASQTITVAGSGTTFAVQNGGSATLIAGLKISVLPGAVVQSGGYFHGYIAPGGPFCITPTNMPVVPGDNAEINPEITAPFIENLFKVYPNPTTGAFTLELTGVDQTEKIMVEVYNMNGYVLLSADLTGGGQHELSLSGKPAGMYVLKVVSEKHTGTKRIIKL